VGSLFFDNASADRTAALIQSSGLGELVRSEANIGYGRGHNDNLGRCRGSYLLLLNPDLEFGSGLFAEL
jgi:GT2 family glycosyltransferase